MAENNNIKEIMDVTLDKIRSMVGAETIIGEPIYTDDIKIIPVSKVSFGVATGGSDFPSKSLNTNLFGGGGGAGVSINPVCFLVVKDGDVRMLEVTGEVSSAERALAIAPDVFEKIKKLFSKKDKE